MVSAGSAAMRSTVCAGSRAPSLSSVRLQRSAPLRRIPATEAIRGAEPGLSTPEGWPATALAEMDLMSVYCALDCETEVARYVRDLGSGAGELVL